MSKIGQVVPEIWAKKLSKTGKNEQNGKVIGNVMADNIGLGGESELIILKILL